MYIVPQNCAPYRPSLFPRLRVSSYMCILTIKGILFYSSKAKNEHNVHFKPTPDGKCCLAYVLLIS